MRYLIFAAVVTVIIETQIVGLLYLHGLNLQMWRAQVQFDQSVTKLLEK